MVKTAFIFPGQGAQFVGMGKELYDISKTARNIFDKASSIVDMDLKKICFEGHEEELVKTANAQIAILTVSLALLGVVRERYPGLQCSAATGLSLGEYSALVASGVLGFEEALSVVKRRGELMDKAAEIHSGGMVSIIGLSEELCEEVAREAGVDVANYNSIGQIVLSGDKERIEKAAEFALAKGARKTVILKVSGAFHSSLMKSAAEGMKDVLKNVELHAPNILFIPNVTAKACWSVDEIKENLIKQVANSVRWTQSMQYMAKQEITHFIEIGPGNVLKGLARRIDKSLKVKSVINMNDIEEINNFLSEV